MKFDVTVTNADHGFHKKLTDYVYNTHQLKLQLLELTTVHGY